MTWTVNFLITLGLILIITYKYLTRNHNYWKDRGIPTILGALPAFGHMLEVFVLRKNASTKLHEIYKASKASMVGFLDMEKPVLLVRHLELVKTVMLAEFNSFSEHPPLDPEADPLLAMDPFFANGETWKHTRGVFTSAFSSKKLKFIATVARDECEKLVNFINGKFAENGDSGVDVNAKIMFSKFTTQVVANVIFGVDGNALVDVDPPESFRKMMDAIFEVKVSSAIRQNIILSVPFLTKVLKVGFGPSWVYDAFTKTTDEIRQVRKNQSITREDFLQHIIEYEVNNDNKYGDIVAAHAFSFFVEGYETSSMTLSAMAYLLSKHPEVQEKMRKEVQELVEKYGEICYDAVNEMNYVEMVILETLRLFPPLGKLQKVCSKEITLEGSDGLRCTLNSGDYVCVSAAGIHRDPEIWSNPDEFNPERFKKDSDEKLRKFAFLAFGDGPRMCPGKRMGITQVKAAIATILMNYVIKPSEKMVEPLEIDPRYFLNTVVGGFWVKLEHL